MLQDIAILTGGTVVSSDLGYELKDATVQMLSHAVNPRSPGGNTTIVGGAGDKDAIAARIAQIRSQIGAATSDFDRRLQERSGQLARRCGCHQGRCCYEVEMKDKKLHIEDAPECNQGCCAGRRRGRRRYRSHQRHPRCA